jgi:hypothetical protein
MTLSMTGPLYRTAIVPWYRLAVVKYRLHAGLVEMRTMVYLYLPLQINHEDEHVDVDLLLS